MSENTPKFPPGPWRTIGRCVLTGDENAYLVADAQTEANAALIAQLPTMFEFIGDLVGACDYGTETLSPSFRERAEKIIIEVYKGSDK